MDAVISHLVALVSLPVLLVIVLLLFPEKIEVWSSLLWKLLNRAQNVFRFAHKKYVKHDLQGRVNEFVRRLRQEVPGISAHKLRIEWVDPSHDRQSFLSDGQVVIRLRRDDPQDNNFVHGAYHFVVRALLAKPKRYLSASQCEAIDLFVCARLIETEKPHVVGVFLDEYLHAKTADPKSKVALYLDDFAEIDHGGLFYPVFIQELQFLGDKVFGRRRNDLVVGEVNQLIDFLRPIALRRIGDEGDLNFDGQYCKVGIVFIGKPDKLFRSINPYCAYIRRQLVEKGVETIYILSRVENEARIEAICAEFVGTYDCVRRHRFTRLLRFGDREERTRQYLVVLRRKNLPLIQPASRAGKPSDVAGAE